MQEHGAEGFSACCPHQVDPASSARDNMSLWTTEDPPNGPTEPCVTMRWALIQGGAAFSRLSSLVLSVTSVVPSPAALSCVARPVVFMSIHTHINLY